MNRIRVEKWDGIWMVSGHDTKGGFWVSPFHCWSDLWHWLFWNHPEIR